MKTVIVRSSALLTGPWDPGRFLPADPSPHAQGLAAAYRLLIAQEPDAGTDTDRQTAAGWLRGQMETVIRRKEHGSSHQRAVIRADRELLAGLLHGQENGRA